MAAKRGFALLTKAQRREVSRKGGKATAEDREHMASIGSKGGQTTSQDLTWMRKIGRKGGLG